MKTTSSFKVNYRKKFRTSRCFEGLVWAMILNSSIVVLGVVLNAFKCVTFFKKKATSWSSVEYVVLIDVTSDIELKFVFQNQNFFEFWCHLTIEFKIFSEKAKIILLFFSTALSINCILRFHSNQNEMQKRFKWRS